MKKKLKFITNLVKDLGYIKLGMSCGKYTEISDNGDEILVTSLAGKYGYKQTPVEKLDEKTIDNIYKDLKENFD